MLKFLLMHLPNFLLCTCFLFASLASGAEDKAQVKFDGFVDTYYAYDFNGPTDFDRSYTTQPERSDEFNVNLAYIAANISQTRVRGRFALQAGTSVQSNYANEASIGYVSGPTLSRNIQEAFVGYQLDEKLWIDAGIYFSHVGSESFISRDNFAYTRSLVSDFSPYYQSGVRLSYQVNDQLGLQLHIVNGWQEISESNHSKTLGTQIAYAANSDFSITYNTLIGREQEFRHFHDFVFKFNSSSRLSWILQCDLGFQRVPSSDSYNSWNGVALISRYAVSSSKALIARVERYHDPQQVIVTTASPNGFDVISSSLGYDVALQSNLSWRSEYRIYWATDSIYPDSNGLVGRDSVLVSSASLSF